MSVANLNDGSQDAPKLRCHLNLGTLLDAPEDSTGPRGSLDEQLAAIAQAGYDGVQFFKPGEGDADACRSAGLRMAGVGRINRPDEADKIAAHAADSGHECLTLHVGWGMESDDEAARLIEAVLDAHHRRALPLYPETHRATIFQDMQRTIGFVRRFPDLRFNGDFSHWYAGQEMVYGGFENKLAFIDPVLTRVRFMHGRIASPGCIQVDLGDGNPETNAPHLAHFRAMWTRAFAGFLAGAAPGDVVVFAPELLSPKIFYARTFTGASGRSVEEGDRWSQARLCCDIARQCFNAAWQLHATALGTPIGEHP